MFPNGLGSMGGFWSLEGMVEFLKMQREQIDQAIKFFEDQIAQREGLKADLANANSTLRTYVDSKRSDFEVANCITIDEPELPEKPNFASVNLPDFISSPKYGVRRYENGSANWTDGP